MGQTTPKGKRYILNSFPLVTNSVKRRKKKPTGGGEGRSSGKGLRCRAGVGSVPARRTAVPGLGGSKGTHEEIKKCKVGAKWKARAEDKVEEGPRRSQKGAHMN